MLKQTVALEESVAGAAPLSGTRWRAKIIAADTWGSSAYYPAEVLERDGGRVFTTGLQMFQNHMTDDEKWQRPEGNVENLVGKLVTDAEFEANGPEGPGLYADVEFYPSYVERITEIAKDVGLSVRASGLTEDAEMDGRYGPVLVAFLSAESVDVVTRAGAGGKLTSILESDRELAGEPIDDKKGTQSMTDITKEDFEGFKTELIEALTSSFNSLKESLAGVVPAQKTPEEIEEEEKRKLAEAEKQNETEIPHAEIAEALRTNDLPAPSAKNIVAALQEGKTLQEAIDAEVKIKEAYVSTITESGNVHRRSDEGGDKPRGLSYAVKTLSGK